MAAAVLAVAGPLAGWTPPAPNTPIPPPDDHLIVALTSPSGVLDVLARFYKLLRIDGGRPRLLLETSAGGC